MVTVFCIVLVIIKTFKEEFRDIYYESIKINKAEWKQKWSYFSIHDLNRYSPIDKKYIEARTKFLNNTKNFYKEGKFFWRV